MRSWLLFLFVCIAAAAADPASWEIDNTFVIERDDLGGLSEQDFEAGDEIDEETELDPDENPIMQNIEQHANDVGKYEGDIILTKEQTEAINSRSWEDRALRNANWPKSGEKVIIPYTFKKLSAFSATEKANIARAITDYENNTCIRIVPRTNEKDYIEIIRDGGCWSMLGKQGGKQQISLEEGCAWSVGTPVHEFMHALGYLHEQARKDRDKYVTINWENMNEKYKSQFTKCDKCDLQGLEYDKGSVMHYGPYGFSKNGNPTITPKSGGLESIGQRNGFSKSDIEGLNKVYCDNTPVTTPAPGTCTDKRDECAQWKDDWCEPGESIWMKRNCRKTCNFCGCKDELSECSGWANRYCNHKKHKKFMTAWCPASCGKC